MVKADFFYADNGLVASTYPGWLQSEFDTLMVLFERVGLRKNTRKTVRMVCRSFRAAGVGEGKSYTQRMTGEGRSFKDRQRERVLCPECGKELTKGSLVARCQNHNGVSKGGYGQVGDEEYGGDKTRTYRMEFLVKSGPRPGLVEGCSGQAATRMAMMVHLWHWHIHATVVIMEEGKLPHPQCPLCDILMPWRSLNGMHRLTDQKNRGVDRK